ncbi:MAG: hypothetical protein QM704_25890 [Anaeromyxobacteraceae bacterium]
MTPEPDARRTAIILWGALLSGCLAFFGVAAYLRASGAMEHATVPPALGLLALGLSVALLAASFAVPRRLAPGGPPETVARVRLLVGWALREAAAMLGTTVWLVCGHVPALAAFVIAVAALAATAPTEARWRDALAAAGDRAPGGRQPGPAAR